MSILVEAVYMRHGASYRVECDDVDEARGVLRSGEDYGELSTVGVFVNGKAVWSPVEPGVAQRAYDRAHEA